MTITLQAAQLDSFGEGLMRWADTVRVPAQDLMAIRLSDIVLQNFGPGEGVDRPTQWPELGPSYAFRYHGGDRTPTEVLTGELRASIDVELGNPEQSRVFTDNDYAEEQQWGALWHGHYIPPRPFFPLIGEKDSATLTPFSEQVVRDAAEEAIREAIASL